MIQRCSIKIAPKTTIKIHVIEETLKQEIHKLNKTFLKKSFKINCFLLQQNTIEYRSGYHTWEYCISIEALGDIVHSDTKGQLVWALHFNPEIELLLTSIFFATCFGLYWAKSSVPRFTQFSEIRKKIYNNYVN